jgi:hypothetical protein
MSHDKTGGPAFPRTTWTGSDKNSAHRDIEGMTLRDWFAGMALCGWAASYAGSTSPMEPEKSAKKAYSLADAMLAERAKTK